MKRVLYWITFIPFCLIMLVLEMLVVIGVLNLNRCDQLLDWIYEYEGWCFDYKKRGLHHIGGGFWSRGE